MGAVKMCSRNTGDIVKYKCHFGIKYSFVMYSFLHGCNCHPCPLCSIIKHYHFESYQLLVLRVKHCQYIGYIYQYCVTVEYFQFYLRIFLQLLAESFVFVRFGKFEVIVCLSFDHLEVVLSYFFYN